MQHSERLLLLLAGFFFGSVFGALVYRDLATREPVPAGAPVDPALQGGPVGRGSDGEGGPNQPGMAGGDPKAMSDVMNRLAELKKHPDKFENQVELGRMYLTVGKFPQAREWLEKAHLQQPKNLDVTLDLAVCRLRTDDVPGAEALFKEGLKLKPDSIESMYGLATIAWADRGDAKAALGWLDRIDKLSPGSEGSAQLRDAIAQSALRSQVSAPPPAPAPSAPR